MASTYSAYKIELMSNGDQPGTWGTTTNNNFQYAIEQAIGGYATQSLSTTSTTLTLADNNGLQNARALFLRFTGTPGSGATVVLPSIQKLYFIKNEITTHDLIVKTSTATTITVPNGKTACIYVDGTDVIGTSDWLPSLTTTTITASGAATIGGNLSVGGTSTGSTYSTYTKTSTKITVNGTGFPFVAGDNVYVALTGGDAPSGVYTVDSSPTPTATAFTATPVFGSFPTGTTGGTVNSVTRYNNTTTIQTPFSSFGSVGTTGQVLVSQGSGIPPTWTTVTSVAGNWSVGGNFAVTGTSTFTGAATFNGNTTVGSTTVTSGTYGRSTTTVTVDTSPTAHGFSTGQILYLVFSAGTGGTATSGVYSITVTGANTFTITDVASGTISGTPAVSITKYNNTATLQAPLSSFGSVGTSGFVLTSQGTGAPPQWSGVSSFINSGTKLSVDSSGNFTAVVPSNASLTPAFFTRAWVNFDGSSFTTVSGTYTWAGSTCTVTKTAHGLLTGDVIYLNFTAGAAATNAARIFYTVTKTGDDTFTVSGATYTQATAAAVSWYTANILGSGNVRLVSVGTPGAVIGVVQAFSIMFTTSIFDDNYAWTACAGQNNYNGTSFISSPLTTNKSFWKKSNVLYLGIYESAATRTTVNAEDVSVVVTR